MDEGEVEVLFYFIVGALVLGLVWLVGTKVVRSLRAASDKRVRELEGRVSQQEKELEHSNREVELLGSFVERLAHDDVGAPVEEAKVVLYDFRQVRKTGKTEVGFRGRNQKRELH